MRLYLVQHGEARSGEADPERRLTDKGRQDVERMASFLEPRGLAVRAIWHSGKARAAETAEVLSRAVRSQEGVIQQPGLAPMDPVEPVEQALASAEGDLMIVGHLPFLARLASTLLVGDASGGVVAFQQGGVVCLERSGAGPWSVRWMIVPELLR